jgi:VIT1/CCC1 family predicted Fe2+/Mn2+ transporter
MSRFSEILFGLIMALGVTGSLSAATGQSADVNTVLWSALGCNLAWGIVDAIMFILTQLAQRGHKLRELARVRRASPEEGRRLLAAAASGVLTAPLALDAGELETERLRLVALPEPASHVRLTRGDLAGALAVLSLVVASTLPVVVPFVFVHQMALALRISQAIGGVLMFLGGYVWGRAASYRPWGMGIAMAALGFAMVAITVVLGG